MRVSGVSGKAALISGTAGATAAIPRRAGIAASRRNARVVLPGIKDEPENCINPTVLESGVYEGGATKLSAPYGRRLLHAKSQDFRVHLASQGSRCTITVVRGRFARISASTSFTAACASSSGVWCGIIR